MPARRGGQARRHAGITLRTRMPASRPAFPSPPRPNTNGSPPLMRPSACRPVPNAIRARDELLRRGAHPPLCPPRPRARRCSRVPARRVTRVVDEDDVGRRDRAHRLRVSRSGSPGRHQSASTLPGPAARDTGLAAMTNPPADLLSGIRKVTCQHARGRGLVFRPGPADRAMRTRCGATSQSWCAATGANCACQRAQDRGGVRRSDEKSGFARRDQDGERNQFEGLPAAPPRPVPCRGGVVADGDDLRIPAEIPPLDSRRARLGFRNPQITIASGRNRAGGHTSESVLRPSIANIRVPTEQDGRIHEVYKERPRCPHPSCVWHACCVGR